MEPEGSLPHSQVPATYPYIGPDRSSPYPPHPTSWRSILILSSHLHLSIPSGRFLTGFPTTILSAFLLSPIRATCLTHLILLDFITRTILGEQYRSLSSSFCSFLHSPVTSSLLGPNILLRTLFSNTLSQYSSLNVSDQVSTPIQHNRKITVLCILTCKFLDSKLQDKRFCTKWQQAFPDFRLLLISSRLKFLFRKFVPKYLNCSTLSHDLLSIFTPWLRPAICSHVLSFNIIAPYWAHLS